MCRLFVQWLTGCFYLPNYYILVLSEQSRNTVNSLDKDLTGDFMDRFSQALDITAGDPCN